MPSEARVAPHKGSGYNHGMKEEGAEITTVPHERIVSSIFLIRDRKVMLDRDLAELYGVPTGNLNRAVKRNAERFPDDFMFQLTKKEYESLRFQFGILKRGQHSKYMPRVFTEQGVAMLSTVLNSKRAIQVNIQIMRTFTRLRQLLETNEVLSRKLKAIEKKYDKQIKVVDERFKVVFEVMKRLLAEEKKPKGKLGFKV